MCPLPTMLMYSNTHLVWSFIAYNQLTSIFCGRSVLSYFKFSPPPFQRLLSPSFPFQISSKVQIIHMCQTHGCITFLHYTIHLISLCNLLLLQNSIVINPYPKLAHQDICTHKSKKEQGIFLHKRMDSCIRSIDASMLSQQHAKQCHFCSFQ